MANTHKGLSEKRIKYIENRMKGKSKRKSALEAGYSERVADNAKTQIEDQLDPKIKQNIITALDSVGFNEIFIAKQVMEGVQDPDEGRTSKLGYLKFGAELRGLTKDEKQAPSATIIFNIPSEDEVKKTEVELPNEE